MADYHQQAAAVELGSAVDHLAMIYTRIHNQAETIKKLSKEKETLHQLLGWLDDLVSSEAKPVSITLEADGNRAVSFTADSTVLGIGSNVTEALESARFNREKLDVVR